MCRASRSRLNCTRWRWPPENLFVGKRCARHIAVARRDFDRGSVAIVDQATGLSDSAGIRPPNHCANGFAGNAPTPAFRCKSPTRFGKSAQFGNPPFILGEATDAEECRISAVDDRPIAVIEQRPHRGGLPEFCPRHVARAGFAADEGRDAPVGPHCRIGFPIVHGETAEDEAARCQSRDNHSHIRAGTNLPVKSIARIG